MEEKVEGMLSRYRVLDLADEKGLLCGKLLGDLGADVSKLAHKRSSKVKSKRGRGVRVADGDGLENRCPSLKDRGFESHPLRH